MPASLTATNRLAWLQSKREAEVAEVTALTERAVSEDRDLSDDEQGACHRRREAVERLDREISVEVEAAERQGQYEQLAERVGPALRSRSTAPTLEVIGSEVEFDTPGEYVATLMRSRFHNDTAATQRIEHYRQTLQRANQTTAENPGLLPRPIIAPIVSDIDASRPAVAAATSRPMPSGGKVFTRPVIASHTTVDKQTAEKTPVASSPLIINDLTVTKETFAGQVNLSIQDEQWTDPAILDILIADLAAEYARRTDLAFTTNLAASVTQQVSATTGATPAASDGKSWMGALYAAAGLIYSAGAANPSTLWVAPDVWSHLGALCDSTGRPLFATANPFNGLGTLAPGSQAGNVAGFTVVVDPTFTPGYAVLGDPSGVEVYETIGGLLRALEPSILGTSVSYYGFFASAVIRPKLFVEITSA